MENFEDDDFFSEVVDDFNDFEELDELKVEHPTTQKSKPSILKNGTTPPGRGTPLSVVLSSSEDAPLTPSKPAKQLPRRKKSSVSERKPVKPAMGVEEEEKAYKVALFTVLIGWLFFPFIAGGYTLYLAFHAEKVAKTGRKRNLAIINKSKRFAFVSFAMSAGLIMLLFILPPLLATTISGGFTRANQGLLQSAEKVAPAGTENVSAGGGEFSLPIAILGSVSKFIAPYENGENVLLHMVNGGTVEGYLVKKTDNGESYSTFAQFLPEGYTYQVVGISDTPQPVGVYCIAVSGGENGESGENSDGGAGWVKITSDNPIPQLSTSGC